MINIDIEKDYGLSIRTMVRLIDRLRRDGWSDVEIQQALDRYHSMEQMGQEATDD